MHGVDKAARGIGGNRETIKMNILFITNHLNIGGITSYVLTLGAGLKKRGHHIYVASSGGSLLPRFMEEGINYISIPIKTKKEIGPKILASLFKLKNAVKKYRIDLVHTNSRTTQVLGCLLSKKTNIAHIYTCHGFFKKRLLRKLFPCWGQKTIAISESVKEHLTKDFGVKEKDIRIVHNGIDLERFGRCAKYDVRSTKKNLGLGDGPVVGIVARLSDVKGHRYLIQAMRVILVKIPDAQLLIVGDGKEKRALVKLINDLGIEKNVFFIPSVTETTEVLSVMDIFVLPSLKEGLGLSLIEAMACGLAVIGSDVGGIKSLIQDGNDGLLVKPADSISLSKAILELLDDAKKRVYLGNNARDFIGRNFSQEEMVTQTEEVYLECVSLKR